MWQYTTETIINSNKGHLGTKKDQRFAFAGGKLLIEGVGSFDPKNIAAVYRTPYMPAEVAEHKLTVVAGKSGEAVRLQIWVSEVGSIRPELQNAFLMKQLPFHFEIISQADAAKDAKALVDAINKMFAKKGAEKLFTAEVSGTSDIVLKATDCYIRINKMQLAQVPGTGIDYNGWQNYTELAVGTVVKEGREGNGTVARLVKNLRIPTSASLNPFGSDHGGKPVPGGEYDQYLIQYVVDRSHMGHQVIGSVADKSMTSHVLFIEKGAITDFEAALTSAGVQATEEDPSALQNTEVGTLAKEVDPKPTKR